MVVYIILHPVAGFKGGHEILVISTFGGEAEVRQVHADDKRFNGCEERNGRILYVRWVPGMLVVSNNFFFAYLNSV